MQWHVLYLKTHICPENSRVLLNLKGKTERTAGEGARESVCFCRIRVRILVLWCSCLRELARVCIWKMVDQYALGLILTSVLGFVVLLYNLMAKKNRSRVSSEARSEGVQTVTTSINGECRSIEGDVDVIIVGAGVAGSALAHTLGKVIMMFLILRFIFSFLFFFCFRAVSCQPNRVSWLFTRKIALEMCQWFRIHIFLNINVEEFVSLKEKRKKPWPLCICTLRFVTRTWCFSFPMV